MSKKSGMITYDEDLHVVTFDLSEIQPETDAEFDELNAELIAFIDKLPRKKPFLLVNWSGTKIDGSHSEHYGKLLAELLSRVKAIFRYGQTDTFTKLRVTVQSITTHSSPTFYASREEAIEAIKKLS